MKKYINISNQIKISAVVGFEAIPIPSRTDRFGLMISFELIKKISPI